MANFPLLWVLVAFLTLLGVLVVVRAIYRALDIDRPILGLRLAEMDAAVDIVLVLILALLVVGLLVGSAFRQLEGSSEEESSSKPAVTGPTSIYGQPARTARV